MNYPQIPTASLLKKLEPPKGRVRMVLDTDTYNEVDTSSRWRTPSSPVKKSI